MTVRRRLLLTLAATLPLAIPGAAQDRGNWRAVSTTARSITGDVAFSEYKIAIDYSTFTIAQIRTLQPAEAHALFNSDPDTPGAGNLYRLSIPAEKRFLHKNTLCGSEETQWAITFVTGHTLQLAFFSGAAMPVLTPDALANTPALCGTYTYTR